MKRIGILTNIDANHGSCVFNFALNNMLHEGLPGWQVKFVDYLTPSWRIVEWLRALKPNLDIPFYNLHRYRKLMGRSREKLDIVKLRGRWKSGNHSFLIQQLDSMQFDVMLVAKVVWDIAKIVQTPNFPNVFWLSEDLQAKKAAYAVSAHRTDLELFAQYREKVKDILNKYNLIGVRDRFTQYLLEELNLDAQVQLINVPDPAFFFKQEKADKLEIFHQHQIDPGRPVLGMLFYGQPDLSQRCYQHFKERGYQVINFSMYNRYVDHNLGHRVDPDEWAALFHVLDFCITDRYHGTIFCIREKIPFVAIEPYSPRSLLHSKIYDVLSDFGLEICYQDPFEPGFQVEDFMNTVQQVEQRWDAEIQPTLQPRLDKNEDLWQDYAQRLRALL